VKIIAITKAIKKSAAKMYCPVLNISCTFKAQKYSKNYEKTH